MKYFIDTRRPIEEATDVEREMPLRAEISSVIKKRYPTDACYFYADRVGMIFIVDLEDAEQLAEIVLIIRRAGLIPTAYPLLDGALLNRILLDIAEIA